jgi:hypothetical protein
LFLSPTKSFLPLRVVMTDVALPKTYADGRLFASQPPCVVLALEESVQKTFLDLNFLRVIERQVMAPNNETEILYL